MLLSGTFPKKWPNLISLIFASHLEILFLASLKPFLTEQARVSVMFNTKSQRRLKELLRALTKLCTVEKKFKF